MSVALPLVLLGIVLSYFFIIFVYRIISKFLVNADAELIKNATISGQNYMSNLGNASEQLLRFLSIQGKN